jgi:hypothetical protein
MQISSDDMSSTIWCYSQRLLNPFRGAVNIIRYKSAEAVTSDGINWDIYVSNDSLLDGLEQGKSVQISDIRYGRWSLGEGLTRGPIYPSDEFFKLEEMGAVVYQHLLKVHDQTPFPFSDSIELWLLDKQDMPLALLNAVVDEKDIDDYQLLDWRAGRRCRETFKPESAGAIAAGSAGSAADVLIEYINNCAGSPPSAQWFARKEDGSATAMHGHNIDPGLTGRVLDCSSFPEHFIAISHDDETYSLLAQEFIEWQSPWLLLLDTLSVEQRRHFEQCARKQALVVDQQYLLYPEVVDESVIRTARVEAKLRKTGMRTARQDEVMSTFYIELNPGPAD